MIKELKRVSLVVALMFLSLFVAATTIQGVNTEALADDPRNVRNIYESYKTQRGPILVDGKAIAKSVPADNAYRFNPFVLASEDLTGFHGTNEKITVANFAQGVRGYIQIIRNGSEQ